MTISSKSHTPSPTPPGSRGEGLGGGGGGSGGNSSASCAADDDLELDMNLEGLNDCTCVVCKSFNQENGNKLMECHTCQDLYHQVTTKASFLFLFPHFYLRLILNRNATALRSATTRPTIPGWSGTARSALQKL